MVNDLTTRKPRPRTTRLPENVRDVSPWHSWKVDVLLDKLSTDKNKGLAEDEVSRRQDEFGLNEITIKKGEHPLVTFIRQIREPLILILIVAGIVTVLLNELIDSAVIFGVVVGNAVVGYIQERKAGKALDALLEMITTDATVLRSDMKRRVSSRELVPGDIVILRSGDKVPADIRLFEVNDLKVDESMLTGESIPVYKSVEEIEEDKVLADRINMTYSGSLVTHGYGAGVVVTTGDLTETGRISSGILSAPETPTPLITKIRRFSRFLVFFIISLAAVTFIVGYLWEHHTVGEAFMAAVALAVSAIPAGLPAAITVTLAIGVSRMAKRNTIIRKMPAVEALGSTTVICSDKTGTLTENQMTVAEIYAGRELYRVTGTGYSHEGKIEKFHRDGEESSINNDHSLIECLTAGLLCNDTELRKVDTRWEVTGDPTEAALIASARKAELNEAQTKKLFPRVYTIPFESHLQYMATLHRTSDEAHDVIFMKGAPEKILKVCQSYIHDSRTHNISEKHSEVDIIHEAEKMAARGLRVLAFAKKYVASPKENLTYEDTNSGFVFLGFQAMLDPPREDAIAAVKTCLNAGIEVKMITGDNVHTASVIAREIGIGNKKIIKTSVNNEELWEAGGSSDKVLAMTGYDLINYPQDELLEIVQKTSVFARVSPEQKLQLVKALQARGEVVAVTGDGVNDAPALKQADIGVAMGQKGTDVSKESADMVLTDDNFASIEAAIEEGRGIFDNITKFITWTLPTNFGEAAVILFAIIAGFALPILPVQILWVNMTTALLLGLMLIFEPKEKNIMKRGPRKPKAPILSRNLIQRVVMVSAIILAGTLGLFILEETSGSSLEEARTVAVNGIIMIELFYLLNSRSLTESILKLSFFSNRWLIVGIISMIMLQVLYTYSPIMNSLFRSAPISLESWAKIIAVAFFTFIIVEIEKWVARRNNVTSMKASNETK
jgi:cation-transporting P-type ATPase F